MAEETKKLSSSEQLRLQASVFPAPWTNCTQVNVNDGGMVRLTFAEATPEAETLVRACVTMHPASAKALMSVLDQVLNPQPPSGKAN